MYNLPTLPDDKPKNLDSNIGSLASEPTLYPYTPLSLRGLTAHLLPGRFLGLLTQFKIKSISWFLKRKSFEGNSMFLETYKRCRWYTGLALDNAVHIWGRLK